MSICAFAAAERTLPVAFSYSVRPTAATGARITTAFRRAIATNGPFETSELRAATLAFAATSKAEGLPPEQVLIALKRALANGGWWLSLFEERQTTDAAPPQEHRVYSQVFGWFLEGYYGAPGPT